MLFNLFILAMAVIVDVIVHVFVGEVRLSPHFSSLFLLYLGFRRPFTEILVMILALTLLAHPFTRLNALSIFLAHWLVLLIIYRLRTELFAEAYLTYALWVFIFGMALQILLGLDTHGYHSFATIFGNLAELSLNSLVMAVLTIPFFMTMDFFYDRRLGAVEDRY